MILAVAAVGATFASCSKSDVQVDVPGKPNELPVTMSLSAAPLNEPGNGMTSASVTKVVAKENQALAVSFGGPDTKAATVLTGAQDSKVYNVWAIQFNAAGKLVGNPYYTSDIPNPGTATGVDATYKVSVNLTANSETGGKVYFIANTNSPTFFNATNAATETALAAVVQSITSQWAPTAAGGVPMLGMYTGAVSASAALGSDVTMKRLVAKVILKYKVNTSFTGFTIDNIALKNVASKIYFKSEPTGIWPAKADGSHIDYAAEDLTKAVVSGDYKTFTWYIPENLRSVISGVTDMGNRTLDKTDGKATYIEIKGTLKSAAKCEKATYSILLGDPNTNKGDFNVKRNTVYTVTVDIQGTNIADKRITVESFDMNNSAMLLPNSGDGGAVTFDIRKCLNNGFTTEANLNSMLGASSTLTADVLWQDGNVINTADITLDKVNGLLTVKSSKATVGNAIVALYPNTSKTQGSILWSWHIWVSSYKPDGSKAYGLGVNSKADVTGGQVHTYGSNFTSKNPGKVIMDRNLGATKAYYAVPAAGDATADQSFGMFYQWGRKDPFPRVQGSTIDASAATGTTIPIYAANGTSTLPEDGTGYKKVNITTSGVISGTNSLQYSVKNPLSFIYNATGIYDWYATAQANQNNALWGDGAQKSAFDPCPKGWRIAPNGTWTDFGTNAYAAPFWYYINGTKQTAAGTPATKYYATNGRYYEPSSGAVRAWYPAPGYRDAGSRTGGEGDLWYVGYNGYSWSSSVSGSNGVYLYFNATGLNPSNASHRAYGFQVRCLQE